MHAGSARRLQIHTCPWQAAPALYLSRRRDRATSSLDATEGNLRGLLSFQKLPYRLRHVAVVSALTAQENVAAIGCQLQGHSTY